MLQFEGRDLLGPILTFMFPKSAQQPEPNSPGEVQPDALVLEMCCERLDILIRGNSHREKLQKNLMNPDELDVHRRKGGKRPVREGKRRLVPSLLPAMG